MVTSSVLPRNCLSKPREMQMEGSRHHYFFQDLFCGREQVKGFHVFPTDRRTSELCFVFSTDDGKNIFRILEVDYSHHIMFYLENFSNSYKLLELYGRVFSHWRSSWGGETREGGSLETEWTSQWFPGTSLLIKDRCSPLVKSLRLSDGKMMTLSLCQKDILKVSHSRKTFSILETCA